MVSGSISFRYPDGLNGTALMHLTSFSARIVQISVFSARLRGLEHKWGMGFAKITRGTIQIT